MCMKYNFAINTFRLIGNNAEKYSWTSSVADKKMLFWLATVNNCAKKLFQSFSWWTFVHFDNWYYVGWNRTYTPVVCDDKRKISLWRSVFCAHWNFCNIYINLCLTYASQLITQYGILDKRETETSKKN